MPIIQPYEGQEVSLSPLPSASQQSIVGPEDFGSYAASQEIATGKQLQAVGSGISASAQQMQNRTDADSVFRAETAIKEKQIQFDADLANRRGQDAWGATSDAQKFWQDSTKDISDGLDNDTQRKLFAKSASRLAVSHVGAVSQYEGVQRHISINDSSKATIALSIDLAAAGANQWHTRPNVTDLQVTGVDKTDWQKRVDGSDKGEGFLGVLQRPDGNVSTEISVGVNIGGKETEIPLLVPTLTRKQVEYLLNNPVDDPSKIPPAILNTATLFAQQRIAQGKSPFAQPDEQLTDPISVAKTDIIKRVMITAHDNGWTQERTDLEMSDELTKMHTQVLQQLAETDMPKAQAYYAFNKDEIAGSSRAGIERVLNAGNIKQTSQETADYVMAQGMGEPDALAYARQKYSGAEREQAVQEIKIRFTEKVLQHNQGEEDLRNEAVSRAVQGKSLPVALMAELRNPSNARVLADYTNAKNGYDDRRRMEADRANKGEAAVKTDIVAEAHIRDSIIADPQGFNKNKMLSDPSFWKLSTSDQKAMFSMQEKNSQDPSENLEVRTVEGQIKASTSGAGLNDTQDAIVSDKMRTAIEAEQNNRGRKLSSDERQKVIDGQLTKGTVPDPRWYVKDPTKFQFEIRGTPDAKVSIPIIPDADREKIKAALHAEGKTFSDADVMRRFKRKNGL